MEQEVCGTEGFLVSNRGVFDVEVRVLGVELRVFLVGN